MAERNTALPSHGPRDRFRGRFSVEDAENLSEFVASLDEESALDLLPGTVRDESSNPRTALPHCFE